MPKTIAATLLHYKGGHICMYTSDPFLKVKRRSHTPDLRKYQPLLIVLYDTSGTSLDSRREMGEKIRQLLH